MADFSVEGEVTLDASQVAAGVNQAGHALSSLNEIVINQWWGLHNLGIAFAGIGAAVASGVGTAVDEAIRWEEAMAGVQRTVTELNDLSYENETALNQIEAGLRDVAAVTPVAASALAGIAEEAGALGIARQDIVPFTKTVADLAAVTDLTEQQAATSFARITALLETPASQFENLASAILEAGISTVSTEPEIVNLATQLAGLAAELNISEAGLIGLSAATTSLGLRAEMSRTAIMKTFADMRQAIADGGDELEIFAGVTGQTVDEFVQTFQDDALEAFTQFVEGLDNVRRSGQDMLPVLNALGIREQRQINTLGRLAAASHSVTNENVQLRNVIGLTTDAFNENESLAAITAARYQTFSMQLQMLRNRIDEVQEIFGATLLPVLKAVLAVVSAFVDGLQALPPGLRNSYAAVALVTGAIGGLMGAVLLILPRIVLMNHSLHSLNAAALQAAGGMGTLGAASQGAAGAVAGSAASIAGSAATINAATAGTGAAAGAAATSMGAATTAAGKLAKGIRFAGKALGVFGAILSVATIGIGIYGAVVGRSSRQKDEFVEASEAMIAVIKQEQSGQKGAIDAWMAHELAMRQVIPTAERLGFTLAELMAFIQGTMEVEEAEAMFQTVKAEMEAGDEGARALLDTLKVMRGQWMASADVVQQTAGYTEDYAAEVDGLTDSLDENSKAHDRQRRAIEERNQAILQYGDALLSQRAAEFAVADAQEAYEEALRNAEDPTLAIAEAELTLERARLDHEDAQRRLLDAEENLATARSRQREELAAALDDLEEANYQYENSLIKIEEAERALEELRQGPTLKEILEATLKLERAQLRLVDANQAVADAEWYLNYLRQEGASNRDILDAENNLANARHEAEQAEYDLGDATDELEQIRAGASPEELAKAERDLEKAYRDSRDAARKVAQEEKDVADIRRAIAEDRAYRDAQRELTEAQIGLRRSILDVAEAEQKLQDILDGDLYRDVAKAQLELEQAMYNLAKANVEVSRINAALQGEFWDTGRIANELGIELGRIGMDAPAAIKKNFQNMSKVLAQAVPQLREDLDEAIKNSFGPGGGGGIGVEFGEGLADSILEGVEEEAQSLPSRIWEILKDQMPTIGGLVGAGVGFAIGGPLGAVLGGLIGTGVGYILGEWGPAIVDALDRVGQMMMDPIQRAAGKLVDAFSWHNIKGGFDDLTSGVRGWVNDFAALWSSGEFWNKIWTAAKDMGKDIVRGIIEGLGWDPESLNRGFRRLWDGAINWVKNFLGIRSPSTVFAEIGKDVVRGIAKGLADQAFEIYNWARNLPGNIRSSIGDIAGRVRSKGADIVSGLRSGVSDRWSSFMSTWIYPVRQRISDGMGNLYDNARTKGNNLIVGLWNGVSGRWGEFMNNWIYPMGRKLSDGMGSLYDWAHTKGHNFMVGLQNGIGSRARALWDSAWDIGRGLLESIGNSLGISSPSREGMTRGQMLMLGLIQGMEDEKRQLMRVAEDVARAALPPEHILAQLAELQDLLPDDNRLRATYGVQAALAPVAAGTAPAPGQGGDYYEGDVTVNAATDADPFEIAEEVVWSRRVQRRG